MDSSHVALAYTMRAAIIEGTHFGSLCATDPDGASVFARGDVDHVTFIRSAVKMIQAIPIVRSGAADRFGLTPAEISVSCASHAGADYHRDAAASILRKCGLDESHLACGAHEPADRAALLELHAARRAPSALYNNCSGKHAGMLAACRASGFETAGYHRHDHPLQREIHALVSDMSGEHDVATGIDGCSLPTFALPIRAMATAMARWIAASGSPESPCARIRNALRESPEMINDHGGFDTEIIRTTNGRIIAKRGAMAVFCVGIDDPARGPVGLAVKLASGDGSAISVAVMNALVALHALEESEMTALAPFARAVVKNWNGIETGEIKAAD